MASFNETIERALVEHFLVEHFLVEHFLVEHFIKHREKGRSFYSILKISAGINVAIPI
jgi:predicted SAM-dependent methyltransferase